MRPARCVRRADADPNLDTRVGREWDANHSISSGEAYLRTRDSGPVASCVRPVAVLVPAIQRQAHLI